MKRLFGIIGIAATVILAAPKASTKPVDLTLTDLQNNKARLRDLRGKIVVLNFWATWCGPCKEEMPLLVEMEKEYRGRGVVFLGASLDDDKTKKRIPDFLSKYHVDFPVWTGATGDDLFKLALGEAVPATAFLDQEGRIVARVSGEIRKEELKERLDWLLSDRTGTPPAASLTHLEK